MATPAVSLEPVQVLLERLIRDREAVLLSQLISKHRNGTITPQDALSGIATLSALRLLLSDADAKLKSPK